MAGFDSDYSDYTVLIVDDISMNIYLLQKILSRFNFNILTAKSGREALSMMTSIKPALVFMDVMMPGMDGLATVRAIRNDPSNSDIRIIMVSALNSEEDVQAALQRGANDYVTKPIIMSTLTDVVMKQMDAYRKAKEGGTV